MKNERTEGWGSIGTLRVAHYFKDNKTLCGSWKALVTPRWESNQELGEKPCEGTCRTCWKKLSDNMKKGEIKDKRFKG